MTIFLEKQHRSDANEHQCLQIRGVSYKSDKKYGVVHKKWQIRISLKKKTLQSGVWKDVIEVVKIKNVVENRKGHRRLSSGLMKNKRFCT